MADKCPICYRNLGTHTHDPILLPNGAPYDWISDTELVYEPDIDNRWYKGTYQINEDDIIELQDELKTLEVDNSIIPLTVFSPLNNSGKFQITGKHIKEMRDSVEKLLDATGLTKIDYFNYDEEGNHIIHPNGDKLNWTDPINGAIDLQKFQIKAIHIEDLRHYIYFIWLETWDTGYTYSDSLSIDSNNYPISKSIDFLENKNWHLDYGVSVNHPLSLPSPFTQQASININLTDKWINTQSVFAQWYQQTWSYWATATSRFILNNQSETVNKKCKINTKNLTLSINLTFTPSINIGGEYGDIYYVPKGYPYPTEPSYSSDLVMAWAYVLIKLNFYKIGVGWQYLYLIDKINYGGLWDSSWIITNLQNAEINLANLVNSYIGNPEEVYLMDFSISSIVEAHAIGETIRVGEIPPGPWPDNYAKWILQDFEYNATASLSLNMDNIKVWYKS
jgi:hypothetical protein